jgi:hypothetical protein
MLHKKFPQNDKINILLNKTPNPDEKKIIDYK